MRTSKRLVGLLLACVAAAAGGCAFFDDEISYNPHVRNRGEMPVLRAMDEIIEGPVRTINRLDRKFENSVY